MAVLQAFADESFKEDDDGGFYVLAAAVLPVERHAELREAMLGMRTERTGKLHRTVLTDGQKRAVVKQVADSMPATCAQSSNAAFPCREAPYSAFGTCVVPMSRCCGSPTSSPGPFGLEDKETPTTPTNWLSAPPSFRSTPVVDRGHA
ncbi:hypothetical protein [Amycolatopsis japonica]|uniref:hypothetical protein n=1 Tax=Amycolatopsis japonica TaxID=208439 RepID=UPI0033C230BF